MTTGPIRSTDLPPRGGPAPSILTKAFLLLECFSPEDRVLTLTELSRRSGLAKSTVHRVLARLTSLGIVEPHDRGYRIGTRLFAITTAMPALDIRQLCLPLLARLQAWSGTVVHLGVLRGVHVVFLERLGAEPTDRPSPMPGDLLPAHCTALGKSLLAWLTVEERDAILPEPLPSMSPVTVTDRTVLEDQLAAIRRGSTALDLGEWDTGVFSAARPLVVHRRPVGAVAVTVPTPERLTESLRAGLHRTAQLLGETLRAHIDAGEAGWHPVEDVRK